MGEITLKLLAGEKAEVEELQRVLELAPGYSQRVTGGFPEKGDAQGAFSALPDGKGYEDKFLYGIYRNGEIIGCVDLIRAHPTATTAFIGLLLLAERAQGNGIGAKAYELVEREVRSWNSCKKVRLAVVRTNEIVLPFWRKCGFRETGEIKPYDFRRVVSESILMEKAL